uniref:phenylalanine--tRNA ligase n=1 Tax=Caloglossa monosticha TaxID=76906 RepID=A0A1Z1M5U0_9FLOR|nr:Phenylalanine-tRNA ligase beta subunit [Caloglossa monosticha]ARW61134.1 Phenylalanine-tRNA ligase beta subunit [Caloglossa monosticha]
MKFSWKVLNFFINLKHIKLDTIIEKLNLNGLEIEKIENHLAITDKTIHLNVTTNRKEIFCIVNLATEISTILNLPLKINSKPIKLIEPSIISQEFSFFNFRYIKVHKIYNLKNFSSPKWLQNYLKACDIQSKFLLYDIQQYIYIKWGHQFHIFDLEKLQINTNIINLTRISLNLIKYINKIIFNKQEHLYFYHQEDTKLEKNIILYFLIYPINQNNVQNSQATFTQAYNETINLISTYSKTTISKSREYYSGEKKHTTSSTILSINKSEIKCLLGPIENNKPNFLSNQQISNILQQLNYCPTYLHNYKIFKIKIPDYRKHDLKRSIDIIEEIGRIYGFEKFLSKLPKYNNKGSISLNSLQIKKIRNTLQNMGFYEAITSSFIKKTQQRFYNINVCNSLTQEQTSLRINIIENLINIYEQNKKNKNFDTEIFEIGKIFYKNKSNHFIHENHIGGLITNHQYIQIDWSDTKKSMNWFHAKGTIENFLDIIQANVIWKNFYNKNNLANFKYITKYYHPNKMIFICDAYNKELIGIFGEIYQKNKDNTNIKNVYLFELNLSKLIKCINYNNHFNHIMKPYSLYPSVTRDISIRLKNKININQIKKLFLKEGINLTESIQVINDYNDIIKNQRSICIRIVYRSYNKTLNNTDLKNIDLNIQNILKILYNSKITKIAK